MGLGSIRNVSEPPLLMSGCEVHTIRVAGMATALQAESSQRNRVSGVSRRSRARSCKSDAGMLVAWTLAGKISLTPRFARRCRCLRHACARREMPTTVSETISHLRAHSTQVCRAEAPSGSTHSSMTRCRSIVCSLSPPACDAVACLSGVVVLWCRAGESPALLPTCAGIFDSTSSIV